MPSLPVRVDLGVMAIKEYSTFPKAPALSKVGDRSQRPPFKSLLHWGVREETTLSPGLLHFTLDTYLIMLSVKQGGIKYHFLSYWYDLTWVEPRSPGTIAKTLPTWRMSHFTGTSLWDYLVSYLWHSLKLSYPSAEMPSVYSDLIKWFPDSINYTILQYQKFVFIYIYIHIYIYKLFLGVQQNCIINWISKSITKIRQIRWRRHAGQCKDELITNILLWTPSHGRARVGQPTRTYLLQLCIDTGCSIEDLLEVMDEREECQERVREICACSMTRWYIYIYIYIYIYTI